MYTEVVQSATANGDVPGHSHQQKKKGGLNFSKSVEKPNKCQNPWSINVIFLYTRALFTTWERQIWYRHISNLAPQKYCKEINNYIFTSHSYHHFDSLKHQSSYSDLYPPVKPKNKNIKNQTASDVNARDEKAKNDRAEGEHSLMDAQSADASHPQVWVHFQRDASATSTRRKHFP